jgi:carbon-monoxide dehydrogenase medium subunit
VKPAAFDYLRPRSVADAASALAAAAGEAKVMAGGQSLGPMLNLRLVQPRLVVDIAGIPELTAAEEDAEEVRLGACVTAANIEDGRAPTASVPMLPRVAGGIAYRAVRNRGTIGGSLCHADPAADWVSALAALGATCVATDGRASRRIPVHAFVTAAFETALNPDEVLEAVIVPKVSKRARFGWHKISRKTGKFAMAIGAVLFDPERGLFRAVMGATHGRPILVEDARELFGPRLAEGPLRLDDRRAGELLAGHGIAAGPARQLHLVALRRAAAEALAP